MDYLVLSSPGQDPIPIEFRSITNGVLRGLQTWVEFQFDGAPGTVKTKAITIRQPGLAPLVAERVATPRGL